ncbi:hypothetical protein T11_12085, partial [Trichinella zimbabwensis]
MIREQPLENSVEDFIGVYVFVMRCNVHHCSALLKCFGNRFDDSDAYKRDHRNNVLVAIAGRNWHGMINRRYQNHYMLIIESSLISGMLGRCQDPVVHYLKFITERNLTNYTYHSFCQTQLHRLVNCESYISSVPNAIHKNYHSLDENPKIEQDEGSKCSVLVRLSSVERQPCFSNIIKMDHNDESRLIFLRTESET